MKGFGLLASGAGLAITLFAALGYRVSVPGIDGENEIINIGLLQNQLMTFQFGLVLILAGIGLYSTGVVHELFGKENENAVPHRVDLRSNEGSIGDADEVPEPARETHGAKDTQALMDSYGIVLDGDKYLFGPYRYDRLEDALAYASRHQE